MRLSSEPAFAKEDHVYYCVISDDKGNHFTGIAKCHPDDQDLESEKVGYTIASRRALLKALKHEIKNTIRPTLNTFQHLYSSMQQSKYFNYKSYEARRVYKTIKTLEVELQDFKTMIQDTETELKDYINQKEEFRQKIREQRKDVDFTFKVSYDDKVENE